MSEPGRSRWQRIGDSDIAYSFSQSPITITAALITFLIAFAAVFAPILSPHTPFDPATVDLMAAA